MTPRHREEEDVLKVPEVQVPTAPEVSSTPDFPVVCFQGGVSG